MNNKVSTEVQIEAQRIANGTQTKGQTKAQTKLIAQGIEKGISEYKKQQKIKARARDKERKKALVSEAKATPLDTDVVEQAANKQIKANRFVNWLPWILLVISWGYIGLILN